MTKKIFSLLLTIILLTCSTGYGMDTFYDAILDRPEFLKDLEEGKLSNSFLSLIQRAAEKNRKLEIDALLKYLKTNPHFTRNTRNFTTMLAIKKNNEPLIKAILECLEDIFANPYASYICYTILTYAKKPEHTWIIPLIPHKSHPNNLNEFLMRAILDKNDFIINLILNHLEFKPNYIIKEILKHLQDPQFKPTRATSILIYAIENQKEPLIKVMLKYLEDHPTFYQNDLQHIIKAAIEHEYYYVIETMLKYLDDTEFQTYSYLNALTFGLIPAIKQNNEFGITILLDLLGSPQYKINTYYLEDLLKHAAKYENFRIIRAILDHENFTIDALEDMLEHAITHHHELAITIMLKYLENELAKKDLPKICYKILSHAIKYNNTFVSTTILSDQYSKNFNEMLMYAILFSKDTSVIDALLQHPQYKPNFILEEIIKHLDDPQFNPRNRISILIYAIENQKEALIIAMLKYLEDRIEVF